MKRGDKKIPFLLIGGVSALLGFFMFFGGAFIGMERFFQDRLFLSRPHDERIIILAIDDAALAQFGQWPWPRETFAKIIAGLNLLNPAAIGIDVNFPEPSRFGPEDDQKFAAALRESRVPVVLAKEAAPLLIGNVVSSEKETVPLEIFREHAEAAYINVVADPDSVVRTFTPFVVNRGSEEGHFAVALARLLGKDIFVPREKLLRINYAGPPETFHTASLALRTDNVEEYKKFTEGKVVIIGATAPSLQDSKQVPTSRGQAMAGAEIHANILDTILGQNYLLPLAVPYVFLIVLVLSFVAPIAFLFLPRVFLPIIASFFGFLLFLGAALFAYGAGTVVPLVVPAASWLLSFGGSLAYHSLSEEREKERIRQTFSRYVSEEVLEVILKNPDSMALQGRMTEVTIIFTDLQGFTSISEELPPQRVIELLNIYFGTMSPIIKTCRGVVDKYIGDAIMAFWCEPFAGGQLADRAVYTAFEMLKAVPEVNKRLQERGLPPIVMRVGVSTGEVIVGDIGSGDRLNFTVIGDAVNTAARLESLNKEYKSHLLVSAMTYEKLTEEFPLEKFGSTAVRGKSEKIDVYGYKNVVPTEDKNGQESVNPVVAVK